MVKKKTRQKCVYIFVSKSGVNIAESFSVRYTTSFTLTVQTRAVCSLKSDHTTMEGQLLPDIFNTSFCCTHSSAVVLTRYQPARLLVQLHQQHQNLFIVNSFLHSEVTFPEVQILTVTPQ